MIFFILYHSFFFIATILKILNIEKVEKALYYVDRVFLWEFTLWKNGTDEVFYERLSLAEANVNKSYSYVNYFDGKLYFYEDETKEELLGFYSCTNTNTVDMKSTKYSSCFITTSI